MRKIDADALMKRIARVEESTAQGSGQKYKDLLGGMLVIEGLVNTQPTLEDDAICECNLADNAALVCEILNADADGKVADLVKVVRCKDCLWLDREMFGSEGVYICGKTHSSVQLDEYCCHGAEMKEML